MQITNISLLSEDNENLPPEIYKIDYKQLCPYLCSKNDIVIRLGNACEEVSLALFFNKEFFKCFHKKVSFDKMTD